MASFDTGATRTDSQNKPDYEGYISPIVKKRFGQYMLSHQALPGGGKRESDNWQKGIPLSSYMKSLDRHLTDLHLHHRGFSEETVENLEETLCAIIFNASGYLFETLKSGRAKKEAKPDVLDRLVENGTEEYSVERRFSYLTEEQKSLYPYDGCYCSYCIYARSIGRKS